MGGKQQKRQRPHPSCTKIEGRGTPVSILCGELKQVVSSQRERRPVVETRNSCGPPASPILYPSGGGGGGGGGGFTSGGGGGETPPPFPWPLLPPGFFGALEGGAQGGCNPLDPTCCEARTRACRQEADSWLDACRSRSNLKLKHCLNDCAQTYPPQQGPLVLAAYLFCTSSCRVGAGLDNSLCVLTWVAKVQQCGYESVLCTGSDYPLPHP